VALVAKLDKNPGASRGYVSPVPKLYPAFTWGVFVSPTLLSKFVLHLTYMQLLAWPLQASV